MQNRSRLELLLMACFIGIVIDTLVKDNESAEKTNIMEVTYDTSQESSDHSDEYSPNELVSDRFCPIEDLVFNQTGRDNYEGISWALRECNVDLYLRIPTDINLDEISLQVDHRIGYTTTTTSKIDISTISWSKCDGFFEGTLENAFAGLTPLYGDNIIMAYEFNCQIMHNGGVLYNSSPYTLDYSCLEMDMR